MAVTFPTDLEIARRAKLLPMPEIAAKMGIGPHLLEPYGYDVAKIRLEAIDELADRPKAKYVVVSAITPTPLWTCNTASATVIDPGTEFQLNLNGSPFFSVDLTGSTLLLTEIAGSLAGR